MSSRETGFIDRLAAASRENPLAAALVGGGALWFLIGNEKLKRAGRLATAATSASATSSADDTGAAASKTRRTEAPPTAPDIDNASLNGVGKVGALADRAAETISETATKVKGGLDAGTAHARESAANLGGILGTESFATARSSLTDLLERRPLVLGAIGLAIGAATAGAFRTSDIENEWLGQSSDGVKANLRSRADAVSQSVREAADTLKSEFGDTAAEAADRLKQAGIDAAAAARAKARS
jgi:hypothetical protein